MNRGEVETGVAGGTSAMESHLRGGEAHAGGGERPAENTLGTGSGSSAVDFQMIENATNHFILSLAHIFILKPSQTYQKVACSVEKNFKSELLLDAPLFPECFSVSFL